MKQVICIQCRKMVEYITREMDDSFIVKGELVKYKKRIAYCKNCGEEVWVEDVDEYNANAPLQKYCENHGLITINQIEQLLKKYNIGQKNLSLLLGWGEVTIKRYLGGQIPSRNYSDILLSLLNIGNFLKVLEENRNNIDIGAYNKVITKLKHDMSVFISNLRLDNSCNCYNSNINYSYNFSSQGGLACKKQLCNC